MSDLSDHLKTCTRRFTQSKGFNPFSYHQCLDLAARFLAGADSWNHIDPNLACEDVSDLDMEEIIRRLQLARPIIDPVITSENDFYCMDLPGYGAYSSWFCGAYIWLTMLGQEADCSESALLHLLKNCPDLDLAALPGMFADGEAVSVVDAKTYPDDMKIKDILGQWFFQHHLQGQTKAWDSFGLIAKAEGFTQEEQQLYRAICREAFNHSWSIESQIALGLFDIPISSGNSLKYFAPDQLKAQLMAIWDYEEPELASQ